MTTNYWVHVTIVNVETKQYVVNEHVGVEKLEEALDEAVRIAQYARKAWTEP